MNIVFGEWKYNNTETTGCNLLDCSYSNTCTYYCDFYVENGMIHNIYFFFNRTSGGSTSGSVQVYNYTSGSYFTVFSIPNSGNYQYNATNLLNVVNSSILKTKIVYTNNGGATSYYYVYINRYQYLYPELEINVYDEGTNSSIANYSITIANSTHSITKFSSTSRFLDSCDITQIPQGFITIAINKTGYAPRSFNEYFYCSSGLTRTYYLLDEDYASFIRFNVINVAKNPIPNVRVSAYYGSKVCGNAYTDESGITGMYLYPLRYYTITFQSDEYTNKTIYVFPVYTEYTVTLTKSNFTIADEALTNITHKINGTAEKCTGMFCSTDYFYPDVVLNSLDCKLEWATMNVSHRGVYYYSNQTTNPCIARWNSTIMIPNINTSYPVLVTLKFKKSGYSTIYEFNRSFYPELVTPSGYDIKSLFDDLKSSLDLSNSSQIMKFTFGLSVIFLAVVIGAMVGTENAWVLGMIIIGAGVFFGLIIINLNIGVVLGIIILAAISIMFFMGGF